MKKLYVLYHSDDVGSFYDKFDDCTFHTDNGDLYIYDNKPYKVRAAYHKDRWIKCRYRDDESNPV